MTDCPLGIVKVPAFKAHPVRRANTEDPHRKVYERAPAVARARAMAA